MKRIAIALIILISANTASAQWRQIADFKGTDGTVSVGEYITCVYFLALPGPPRIGFVGTESELHKTTDGGQTWRSVWDSGWSFDGYYPTDICFKDSLTGWFTLFGDTSVCYRTKDGGETWTSLSIPGPFASAIYYCSMTKRLFVSTASCLRMSTNLGDSWNIVAPYETNGLAFASDSMGIAIAYPSDTSTAMALSTDGGMTWELIESSNSAVDLIAISGTPICFEADRGWHRIIRRSDDFGRTWRQIADLTSGDSTEYCTGIIRGDRSRLYTQTDSGMYVSVDEGVTWKKHGGPTYSTNFTNDRFYAANGVTIAGMTYGNGALLSGGLWEEDWPPEAGVAELPCIDSSLSAISVSENPLHEATTLRFELTDAEYVRVEVFDVLGYNTPCPSLQKTGEGLFELGQHQIPIDFSRCTSGTYYLRITFGTGEVRTIKLVKE